MTPRLIEGILAPLGVGIVVVNRLTLIDLSIVQKNCGFSLFYMAHAYVLQVCPNFRSPAAARASASAQLQLHASASSALEQNEHNDARSSTH